MRQGSATLLKVEYDDQGQAAALKLGGMQDSPKISLEMAAKPRLEMVRGKNVVGGMEKAVSKITMPDGKKKTYEYALNEKLQPTLNVDGKRLISWNPGNSRIIKDGEWAYDIWSGRTSAEKVALGRTDAQGKYEFWKLEDGKEIRRDIDGITTIRTWFTSGILAGKSREIRSISSAGNQVNKRRLIYDDKGRLIRDIGSNGEHEEEGITYDDKEKKLHH